MDEAHERSLNIDFILGHLRRLRTREGLDMGSGLYLYVLTATGPGANGQVARGKFVIIR